MVRERTRDTNDQFDANVTMSMRELGKGNISLAEECGTDDFDGKLEENSKATIDINDRECNMITDTEDNIGIIFESRLESSHLSRPVLGC